MAGASRAAGRGPDELFERARRLSRGARPAEAERLLLRVLDLLGNGRSPRGLTRARVLLTLAYVKAELDHVSEGLRLLDDLQVDADPAMTGLIASQRGLMLIRAGDLDAAAAPMDIAVRELATDPTEQARALLNRGYLRLTRGDLDGARRDFETCVEVAGGAGLVTVVGQARHNLGYLAQLAGDLPRALQEMDDAAEALREWKDLEYVYRVDRARVLFAAGLLAEADEELALAARHLGRGGRHQDRGEVDLSRAQVAMADGRPAQARALGLRAARLFTGRGSQGWARLADLTVAQAMLAHDPPRPVDPTWLVGVAAALERHGLADDARLARLTVRRAQLVAAGPGAVVAGGDRALVRLSRRDRISTRLVARELRADLAEAEGEARRAATERMAGLRELHRYAASFGSLDLQTATAVHGRRLADAGLAAAVATGRPAEVLDWSERSRACASRLPPVRPPDDSEAAALLAQLRFTRQELREVELAGRDDPVHRRRIAELEQRIRQRSWYVAGPGDVENPARLGQVREALAGAGTLVAHVVVAGLVHALVVTPRRAGLVGLGPVGPMVERLRLVRADLDMLAMTGYPAPMRASVSRSLARGLDILHQVLWRPLQGAATDGPLVLVPAGALGAVPWTMLPGLRGRPITVAQSATAWLLQRRPPEQVPAAVVAASGPDLARADEEVTAVAGLWPGARALAGAEATGEALLDALGTSALVHVAAHGTHETTSPLFSALRLADGPLFGYDLARAARLPDHVVLSACDLGRATERPGDELLGMTAALLHAGTRSVVASVARLGDGVASEVTVDYHCGLRAGLSPSQALAAATEERDDAPLVCFGGGW